MQFVWDSSFVTGLEEVDKQHFRLVELVNAFCELLEVKALTNDMIEYVFKELFDYTSYHFQEEEKIMRKGSIDPEFLKLHIKIHQEFLTKIRMMKNNVVVENVSILNHMSEFLINWLVAHILGMDKCTAAQLDEIKKGMSAGDAYKMSLADINEYQKKFFD